MAAVEIIVDATDGMGLLAIHCVEPDLSLQSERRIPFFDLEDNHETVTLREQWQTELGD